MRRTASLIVAFVAAAGVLTFGASPAIARTLHMSQLLAALPVAAQPTAGYKVTAFKHWVDADHNGCDTRQEVLKAESTVKVTVGGGCKVTKGRWVSSYDKKIFTAPGGLDIDHFVPLAEAWSAGASKWDAATRQAFANDLGFSGALIAVSAASNRSKGDRDPAQWLPPNTAYRCAYVASWLQTKYRWQLSVDSAEKSRLRALIVGCKDPGIGVPGQAKITREVVAPRPTPSAAPKPTPTPVTVASASPSPMPSPSDTASPAGTSSPTPQPSATSSPTPSPTLSQGPPAPTTDPRYGNCADAKKYGHAPYYAGRDPEYSYYTDRDHDGVVCE